MIPTRITIGIAVYNEEQNIEPLIATLLPIVEVYDYEILFVNDGSQDGTAAEISKHAEKNTRIKLVSFYRNFGHQTALSCVYKYAHGDCVVTIDADLQDPPELIPSLINKWRAGAKVVYAKRKKRDVDSFFKKITAQMFYSFINFLSDIPIPHDVGDYRLVDREVVEFLNQLPEHSKFFRGLVAWGGFPSAYVEFDRGKRHSGETHYTLGKMVNFALEGITSFSAKPLRLASYAGFISATLGFAGIVYAILGRIFFASYWVTGWTGLFVGVMFLGGVQLITIGIIGEYLKKIYQEVHQRPEYLVREKMNL